MTIRSCVSSDGSWIWTPFHIDHNDRASPPKWIFICMAWLHKLKKKKNFTVGAYAALVGLERAHVYEALLHLSHLSCQHVSSCVSSDGSWSWTPLHTDPNDRAFPPKWIFKCMAWLHKFETTFPQLGHRAWRLYAASGGSAESSCLWSPYHTCRIDLASMSTHVSLQIVSGAEPLSTQTTMVELPIPSESSNAWLGCIHLKRLFHSWGIDMTWRPYAASGGFAESSCLWNPYHACPIDSVLPAWLFMCLFRGFLELNPSQHRPQW